MRLLQRTGGVWAAGLFIFCLLGSAQDAAAGPYDNLKWKFSVPVKLNNIMPFFKWYKLRVQVYSAEGAIGEGEVLNNPIGPDGSVDTVVGVTVKPYAGRNPFLATRYTVDFRLRQDGGPGLCDEPGFGDNIQPECRALNGTELVYHIDEPMPSPTAEVPGGGNTNVFQ